MPPVEGNVIDHKALLLERLRALRRGAPQCAIVLSSRLAGYTTSPIPEAVEWQLRALTRPQLRAAVEKWLSGDSKAVAKLLSVLPASLRELT